MDTCFSVSFSQALPAFPHVSANKLVFLFVEIDDALSELATGIHLLAILLLEAVPRPLSISIVRR
jgi:hypothetical protein